MVISELQRRDMSCSSLRAINLHFSDTLYDCRLLAKSEEKNMFSAYTKTELKRLGIENLYTKYYPGETYNAHRALADILAMEKLFTTTPLASVLSLSTLTIRSIRYMMSIWHDKTRQKETRDTLLGQLKSAGTASLAKRLCAEGLTYSQIKAKYSESASYKAFSDWHKSAGVRYKLWHEKLHSHFKKECKKLLWCNF